MYSIEAAAANRLGNDWLIGKSRDTFAPLGPFIVPKEFVPNARNMSMRFALNAETLQEGNTSQMIHDVFEFTAYGSNIVTLRPGDVIGTGTPAGVGSARTTPIYLKDDGDRSCARTRGRDVDQSGSLSICRAGCRAIGFYRDLIASSPRRCGDDHDDRRKACRLSAGPWVRIPCRSA